MGFINTIDWLEFSLPQGNCVTDTLSELDFYVESKFIASERAMLGYDNMLIGTHECKILSSNNSRRPEHHVILPGKWCREVGMEKLPAFIAWVVNHKGTFSRVDFACDDYSKNTPVERVLKSIEREQMVSHCHKANVIRELRGGEGITLNIGSKKSERFLRIYDKAAESKGEMNCTRWEIMFRNENADIAIGMYLNADKNLFERLIVGLVDFREKNDCNSTRRTRLNWFKQLVMDLRKADFYKAKIQVTVAKMESWIRKQVAPSLACVLACKQGDLGIFEDIAKEGSERWRPVHHIAMALR